MPPVASTKSHAAHGPAVVTSSMIGGDGRVNVWDVDEKQYKRVFPIDAREQLSNGSSTFQAPMVLVKHPSKKDFTKILPYDEAKPLIAGGWELLKENLTPEELIDAEGDGAEIKPPESGPKAATAADYAKYTVEELRGFVMTAGLGPSEAEAMKKTQLIDYLVKNQGIKPVGPAGHGSTVGRG